MKRIVGLVFALASVMTPIAAAQDNAAAVADLTAMQQAARKDKRALMADKLQLTPAEAKKFWPIYDTLQRELSAQNRTRNLALETLVARDRPLSDAYARNVVNELLSVEEQEVKSMRKAGNAAMRALPPKKAARFLQLEQKLRAVQDYEIAVAFPLAQ